MKKTFLLLGLSALLFTACSEDDPSPVNTDNDPPVSGNNVLMLKVDYQTYAFEGGKELTFPAADTFTISSEYVTPADFGSIKLNYEEVDQPLFDGTIVWMGLGERSFPETIGGPDTFVQIENPIEMPAIDDFEKVTYTEEEYLDGFTVDHQALWTAIYKLEAVKRYRQSNPDAKVHVFLYTPSVGIGDPADWDWYVVLKN